LNTLLASHPDVYVPTLRDEINFFDQYWDRGLGWYGNLFPPPEEADRYRAIGEVTPQYLECESCPERIFATIPRARLIVMLRHPVDRAYSQYGFFVQRRNYRGSFQDFVAAYPRSLERGFYSRYLRRYLQLFDRSSILALVFEDVFADVPSAKEVIAGFLDIAVDRFPSGAGSGKVNPSTVPAHQALYGGVAKTGRQLRRWGLEPVVDFFMRTRAPALLSRGSPLPRLDSALKRELAERYREELDALEECTGVSLAAWRG
jgi:hypothetical protein